MKKLIITHGLLAGFIATAFMIYSTVTCYTHPEFQGSIWLGYGAMLLAFAFVFTGIRKARDQYHEGVISFGRAFRIGLYIALVASTLYVVAWLVEYYLFMPDFWEKYTAHVMHAEESRGATAEMLERKAGDMEGMGMWYRNPAVVVGLTYLEIFPGGLIVAFVSAWILRRRHEASGTEAPE